MTVSKRSLGYGLTAFLVAFGFERVAAADNDAFDLRGPAPQKGHIIHEVAKFKLDDADFTLSLVPQNTCSVSPKDEIAQIIGRLRGN
jgi:hypothetical protein